MTAANIIVVDLPQEPILNPEKLPFGWRERVEKGEQVRFLNKGLTKKMESEKKARIKAGV